MRRVRWLALAVLAMALGAWVAVGAGLSSASTMTVHNRIKENATTHRYHYTPKSMSIKVGDKVVWTDRSDAPHTVTFDRGTYNKSLQPGTSVSRVFKHKGTFTYHCNIH